MRRHPFLLFLLACATLCCGLLTAQKGGKVQLLYLIPEKLERQTKADQNGLLQWVDWQKEPCLACKGAAKMPCPVCAKATDKSGCPQCHGKAELACPTCGGTGVRSHACETCKGSGKTGCSACERIDDNKGCVDCQGSRQTACRVCGGKGQYADPLEKIVCPSCMGGGQLVCVMCGGGGVIKTQGGGKQGETCMVCRGDKAFKCPTCGGARLIEAPALKPSLKEAPAPALHKAHDQIEEALKALAAFDPGKDARKAGKNLAKLIDPLGNLSPSLRKSGKGLEDMLGKVAAGAQFQGQGEREGHILDSFRRGHEYYLKSARRMLELCIARAEANDKTLAEKKEKKV